MNINFNGIHIEKDGNLAPTIMIFGDTILIKFSKSAMLIQVEKEGRVNLSVLVGDTCTYYTYTDVESANKVLGVHFSTAGMGQ